MPHRLGNLYLEAEGLSEEGRKLLTRYVNGDGMIVGWGLCHEGELGTCARYNVLTPLMIGGRDKPMRMACSGMSSIWLGIRNVVLTMGSGMWGELGVGNPRFCPQVIANEMNLPICPGQVEMAAPPGEEIMVDVNAAFAYISCVTLHGSIYAWGANNYGQCHPDLSNACCGFAQQRILPNEVAVQVVGANYATLARTASGNVYGWGLTFLLGAEDEELAKELHRVNDDMNRQRPMSPMSPRVQLVSIPNTDRRVVPVAVPIRALEGEQVVMLRAGPWHFVAITATGCVLTWGLGNNGRLGHGNEDDQLRPTIVVALADKVVVDAACGSFHTVFVTEGGEAYACGDNEGGQCGVLGESAVLTPTRMKVKGSGRRVIQASCGRHHTTLLLNNGDVVVYGSGLALGVGTGYGLRQVRCQALLETYTALWLSSGPVHSFALVVPKMTSMLVLGMPHRGVPCAVSSVGLKESIVSCGVGAGFTLLVSRRGSAYAFGLGGWGQLGFDVAQATEFTPERVPVIPHATRIGYFMRTIVTSVAAGFSFSMAIIEGERVFAWGNNSYGQCGLGVDPNHYQRISQPREIVWLADKEIVQVSCGNYFALALGADGSVYSWGTLECCGHGKSPTAEVVPPHMLQRDVGSEKRCVLLSPAKIVALQSIIQVAAGSWHALALNAIGEIYAWGVGLGGRLGLGDTADQYTPVRIVHTALFTRIGCGCYTSYAIDDDAKLYLWGVNDRQQLGCTGKVCAPRLALEQVREVCLGKYFTLALTYHNSFHMAGVLEGDHETYKSSSFYDESNLPEPLRTESLAASRSVGLKLFGGVDHAIALFETDTPSAEAVEEVTRVMRSQPEAIIRKYSEPSATSAVRR